MIRSTLVLLGCAIAAFPVGRVAAAEEPGATAPRPPGGLSRRVWEITDVVLAHHVDPPTRQEMILRGLSAVYRMAKSTPPQKLAQRVSTISAPEQLAVMLDELWPGLTTGPDGKQLAGSKPEELLLEALAGGLPGGGRLLSAGDLKVEQQFQGNRYVGLHIAIGMDANTKRTAIAEVFPGGPADRAGLKKGDVIEAIDGVETDGWGVKATVDRLRGLEGTQVTLRVRQPGAAEARVVTATRGTLPRKTVKGLRNRADGSLDVLVRGEDAIGYLKIEEVLGSTPQELRSLVRRMEEEGARAMILDLRPVRQAHLHPTVLLADTLLESGTIGRVRSVGRVETFRADSDVVFRDGPIAVLVTNETPRLALWLAAALQDNRRATVVGAPARRPGRGPGGPRVIPDPDSAEVWAAVPIGDGTWSIEMPTGCLERGDGRAFGRDEREQKESLVPDVLVPGSASADGPSARPARRPEGEPEPEGDPDVRGDAILNAALEHLRARLKTP